MREGKNTIYFENGISHELSLAEIEVIRRALKTVNVKESQEEALNVLRSLFFDYLD
ncbi:hypothetical protein ACMEEA_001697 [Campylobacter jejuni]|uniref:hypothetical protein n=1 Tax=Lacticaseibacillus paracasei TaxID=1597 RepID=UPI0031F5781B